MRRYLFFRFVKSVGVCINAINFVSMKRLLKIRPWLTRYRTLVLVQLVCAFWCGSLRLSAQHSYLVSLSPTPNAETQLRARMSEAQTLRAVSKRWGIYELQSPLTVEARRWEEMPGVRYFGPNRPVQLRQTPEPVEPDDTRFAEQWNLARIAAAEAWGYTTGGLSPNGDTLVVAVLDAGCDVRHPDLAANLFHNWSDVPGNAVDDDANGYVDDHTGWDVRFGDDDHPRSEHGTSVAGIIGAAGNNGKGISGVCWAVKLLPLTLTDLTEAEVIAAYDYILTMRELYASSTGQRGAYIVATNASFGVDYGLPQDYPLWCAVFDSLGAAGILNVAATANFNTNVDVTGDIPTACGSPYLITVTATNLNDGRAANSAYGPNSIDLGAPGGPFVATKANGFYNDFQGTSAAAPQVAGAIALLYSLPAGELGDRMVSDAPGTALLLKQALLDGAEPNNTLQGYTVSGGRLQLARSIVAFGTALGIDNEGLAISLLGPNPVETWAELVVDLPQAGTYSWEMVDACGAVLRCGEGVGWGRTEVSVDMAAFVRGVYFFRVKNGNDCEIKALLKI